MATHMPTLFLKIFFICFLFVVSAQMLSNYRPPASRNMPGFLGTSGVGGIIGLISSFVGIGGGTLSVPFMSFCNVPLHDAVGTSAAIGFPIAVAGTLSYIIGGWGRPDLPPYTWASCISGLCWALPWPAISRLRWEPGFPTPCLQPSSSAVLPFF